MRKTLLVFFVMAAAHVCGQHVVTVREFIDKGTWVMQKPMATDSVDMYGNKQNFVGGTGKEVQFFINNSMFTNNCESNSYELINSGGMTVETKKTGGNIIPKI